MIDQPGLREHANGHAIPIHAATVPLDRLAVPAWLIDDQGVEIWRNALAQSSPQSASVLLPVELSDATRVTLCIGDRKADDDFVHERLIAQESQHRARNIIALAIAIANQSFGPGPVAPPIRAFMDRLRSLDAVASVGCEVEGDRCPLRTVIDRVTRRFDDAAGHRFDIAGNPILIPARWAHLIALVVHELAANAIRHGALRGSGGQVSVRWETIPMTRTETGVRVIWREHGLLPLPRRNSNGFGMKLLCDAIAANPRCEGSLQFRPTGLDYSLTLRLRTSEVDVDL